jgi:hypothetical protein
VDRTVTGALEQILQGSRDVAPLGLGSLDLRKKYSADIHDHNLARVVERIEELRASDAASPSEEEATPGEATPAPADSAG